jgi:hypothetical protein
MLDDFTQLPAMAASVRTLWTLALLGIGGFVVGASVVASTLMRAHLSKEVWRLTPKELAEREN